MSSPPPDPRPTPHADLERARTTLATVFGFPDFRPGQADVVAALLARRSALAVFPTGGGKSLCYQLPALLLGGLTLVVSPLIALMKDQVDHLRSRGVDADRLDSSRTSDEVRDIYGRMAAGTLRLLYVAPERLSNAGFRRRLARTRVTLLAVDEAHCISEWGHNFRPDYLKLADSVRELGIPQVLALTATATPAVSADICRAFSVAPADHIQTGFRRPNLTLRMARVSARERAERLPGLVASIDGPTIVYVTLQKTAERVARALSEAGLPAEAYHAGMKPPHRAAVQDAFMADQVRVVVATIAFGMGIDKANIRGVVHYNLPKSLEGYSQQVGRAGRDGAPSECIVMACADDLVVLENFTYGDTPTEAALRGLVAQLLEGPAELSVSRYHLSKTHDLRGLVVSTALTYLELDGVLEPTGPFYDTVGLAFKTSEDSVLEAFSGERRTFVEAVFAAGRRGRKWLTIEVSDTAEALGQPRSRIQRALSWMEQQGWVETTVKGLRHGYIRASEVHVDTVVASLVERFIARERADLARTDQMRRFAEHEGCLTAALVGHFGETLDGPCGHCGPCAGEAGGPLPRSAPTELDAHDHALLEEVAAERHRVLAHPRALARFLCGLSSPAFQGRGGLSHDRRFGRLGTLPFSAVLAATRARLRPASAT